MLILFSVLARAQSTPSAEAEAGSNLKVDVTLVPVDVVVRDQSGKPVGNLRESDFQLFDNGRQQVITQFSSEHVGNSSSDSGATESSADRGAPDRPHPASGNFTAYLFDDVHMTFDDLKRAQLAADHQLASLSPATDRAAIFTTSGQAGVDFTADRAKLHDALVRLQPHGRPMASDCRKMSYYTADLIVNKQDQIATQHAIDDALACAFDNDKRHFKNAAAQMAREIEQETAAIGRVETMQSLGVLKALVRGMSKAPGRRTIVMVSPGFFGDDQVQIDIIDLAVRSEVTVSALDPRGLVLPYDGGSGGSIPAVGPGGYGPDAYNLQKGGFDLEKTEIQLQDQAVLQEVASGTGGVFFHNDNDLDAGFKLATRIPEYSYVLAFAPKPLKYDGGFHSLRVSVNRAKLTVQARKGYYAPKQKP